MSLGAVGIGFVAGMIAGMFGVGGGVVFVPGLVILLGVVSWVLFRPATTPFFRRDERPAPVRL